MHEKLKVEHAKFEREHADALERCSLYDRDMLEKSGRIKNHEIELTTLERLLLDKTKEISNQLSEVAVEPALF